jgi:hypothetical protein
MTKEDLINKGFCYVATDTSNLELWASFTGWKDAVQYYWVKDDQTLGEAMVTSFGALNMFNLMFETLRNKQLFQNDIDISEMSLFTYKEKGE